MTKETWAGLAASTLTTVSLIPQLIKLIREKKAEGVSLQWLTILFAGLCCWIYYGVLKSDMIIIISNIISALINAAIGVLAIFWKRHC